MFCLRFAHRPLYLLRLIVLAILLPASLISCNNYLVDGVRVAWAKQLFQQGSYQEALLHFLDAEQNRRQSVETKQLQLGDSGFLALRRIQYNIGLIYSALGQSRAAIERWHSILSQGGISGDELLQFSLLYNISLLYSQIGQNNKARHNLVQALNLRPNHEGARKALELSLKHLTEGPRSQQLQQENIHLKEPLQSRISDEQILNYISRQANYRFKRDVKVQQVLRNDW